MCRYSAQEVRALLCNFADKGSSDIGKLSTCYDSYSKNINCKAKIIQYFVSVVENVAQRVLDLFNDVKSFCPSSDGL